MIAYINRLTSKIENLNRFYERVLMPVYFQVPVTIFAVGIISTRLKVCTSHWAASTIMTVELISNIGMALMVSVMIIRWLVLTARNKL